MTEYIRTPQLDYEAAKALAARARDPHYAGKPLQYATRLFVRGDKMVIRQHATDIVTINPDGTFTLANGGWNTVTTSQRIRSYSPAHLFSERGEWYIRSQPNPKDPRPDRVQREVPKPYTVEDPGPEPVKTATGWTAREDVARSDMTCFAGKTEQHEKLTFKNHFASIDMNPSDVIVVQDWYREEPFSDMLSASAFVKQRGFDNGHSDKVMKLVKFNVFWGEGGKHWHADEAWATFTGTDRWSGVKTATVDGETWEYRQCPHCAEFDKLHARWNGIMHGHGYGRNRQLGYATMIEMLDRFDSMEGWREAYLADFRARRAYLKAAREWEQRNRVPFYDGITVNSDGYAPRLRVTGPSPAKLRRHEAKVKRIKAKIDNYVAGYIEQLKKGMPMPSNGDCWFCLMMDTDKRGYDEGMNDHLLSHISAGERYYVPSLAVNALRERGYKDVGIYMWLDMNPERNLMGGKDTGSKAYDTVRRDLRKYLNKRLIPAAPIS